MSAFCCFLFHFFLLIIFIYLFFVYRKIGKALNGVLARVHAQSSGSSPGSNPAFDVSLSHLTLPKLGDFLCFAGTNF